MMGGGGGYGVEGKVCGEVVWVWLFGGRFFVRNLGDGVQNVSFSQMMMNNPNNRRNTMRYSVVSSVLEVMYRDQCWENIGAFGQMSRPSKQIAVTLQLRG